MILPFLSVKDVDASAAFYVEKLGFTLTFSMPGADGKTDFAFVNLGEAVTIGLTLNPTNAQGGTGANLMIYVPDDVDLDTLYANVQARGVAITEAIQDQFWGDRTFALRDLNGYYLTFARTVKAMSFEEAQKAAQRAE